MIKPHPREKEDFYENVVKKNIRVTILPSISDTFEALYACDLLVAACSTVITEALVLGKPAVTVNLTVEKLACAAEWYLILSPPFFNPHQISLDYYILW